MSIFQRFFGSSNDRKVKGMNARVAKIREDFGAWSYFYAALSMVCLVSRLGVADSARVFTARALGGDIPIIVVAGATLSGRSRWGRLCLGIGTSGPGTRLRSAFPALRHAGFLVALLADLPAT